MYNKLKVLREMRKHLTNGSLLSTSIERAGVKSVHTVANWRKTSPRIDRYVKACMERSDDKRTDIVEDAFMKKLASGEGSPTDYIFYLTNRRPKRWKHQNAQVNVGVNVDTGDKIVTPHAVIFSAVKDECQTQRL